MDKLNLTDFLYYNYLSNMESSPDEVNIAFVTHRADVDTNGYRSYIWIMNTLSKEYFQLTGLGKENSFQWLDNENIIFSSMRNEQLKKKVEDGEEWSCYYTISIKGGEAREFMRIPLSVTGLKVVDRDRFIITSQYDNYGIKLNGLTGEKRAAAIKEIEENKDYEVLDEIPFWSNGGGFTNKKRNRLYLYNRKEDRVFPITDTITQVESFTYKDGKILYIGNSYINKKGQTEGIFCYDIESGKTETVLPIGEYSVNFAEFFGDGIICGLNDQKSYGLNQNPDFYIIKDGKAELFKKHDTWMTNTVGSDCRYGGGKEFRVKGDKLYFITTVMHSSYLNTLDIDGNEKQIVTEEGSVDGYAIGKDEIFFIGMRDLRLQEIYTLKNNEEKLVTDFNESIYAAKTLSRPEKLSFVNDGIELEGWVLKPVGYEEGKQYPGILDIHGGPKTVFGTVFYHEMQVWANMGYFVFFCNPRGGDGRGNEFADIRGKYGTIDYEDLMAFTDRVLEKYPIDREKVGVTGGSYGGFMTNWIIGHTDRFACAASQRSIANWFSKFGTTDIGYYFNVDQNASSPWVNPDKLWWHSPMKYADKVKTPTLFIHSEQDYRCWIAEGLQMFTSLKYHGVPARLCMFRGENHELSRSGKPKHRIRRLKEMTEWFEEFLK
ncbi:alpha/beta hydrolase family protein [Fusobacterium sp.]|uniref:alpha/beta hydrolase family protein n=1 Tax=Fusobacterium sp. TaxID=68766 RepID=UPI00396CA726